MLAPFVLVFIWICLATQTAFAHDGQPPAPHDLWSAWNWEPSIVLGLILTTGIYLRGVKVLQSRSEFRQEVLGRRVSRFMMGLAVLFVALISPLDALATALFSAHMLQHMLLILIAPPLLILSVPLSHLLLGLPAPLRSALGNGWQRAKGIQVIGHALANPFVAWSLHTFILWVWHMPGFYEAALQNEIIHILEHISFLGTALLFWYTIISPQRMPKSGEGIGILSLFTMALQGGFLGALIIFTQKPWYSLYGDTTQPWGLTPLEDQQLAGAIMWIPAGVVYTLAALILLMRRLASIESAAHRHEVG